MIMAFYLIFKGRLFNVIYAPQISKRILNFLIALTFHKGMKKFQIMPKLSISKCKRLRRKSRVQDHWQGGVKKGELHLSEIVISFLGFCHFHLKCRLIQLHN